MTERARDAVRARIRALATLAFDAVPATRPIGGFIATNPLAGLERLPFVEAVASMRERTGARGFLPEREYRKRLASGEIARDAFERALANATEANGDTSRTICGNTIARRAAFRGSLLGEDYSEPLAAAVRGRLAGMAAHARDSLPPHVLTVDIADAFCVTAIAALVDERTICWCAAYLDEGQAAWHMPHRERGLYAAWRTLARFDTSAAARAIPAYRERLDAAPDRADDAIVDSLARLAIAPGDWEAYLTSHVLRLPGWAGLLKTRATMDYLAIRLWYEAALVRGVADRHGVEPTRAALAERFGVPRDETGERFAATALTAACAALGFAAADVWSMDDDDLRWLCDAIAAREPERRGAIWLEAHERSVRDGLLRKLAHRAGDVPAKARVDVTFCIDARSEGLRRHLEALGPYRTRGFAGFFGLPVALRVVDSQWAQQACPVLLTPKHEVVEVHRDEPRRVARAQRGRRVAAHVRRVLHDVKSSVASPYVLFEAIGAAFAVALAGRTLVPAFFGRTRERVARAVAPAARTGLVVAKEADGDEAAGFTHDERVFFAESALSLMGMREDFARLAVFAGHGSSTENNPFEASLDCGACAGNRGGPNARDAAQRGGRSRRARRAGHRDPRRDVLRRGRARHGDGPRAHLGRASGSRNASRGSRGSPQRSRTRRRGACGRTPRGAVVRARALRRRGRGHARRRPIRRLGAGAAGMGSRAQRGVHHRAAQPQRRRRPRAPRVSARVRRGGRSRRDGARSHHDRASGRGPMDQQPLLLRDRRQRPLRQRQQGDSQRRRMRRRDGGEPR
jgi:uncharacterized protein YbcC (UPF0753/DUF2309 family)